MRKLIAAFVLLTGAAQAGQTPSPVCGDPGVLRQVGETLRGRGQALALDVPPVGEVSTTRPAGSPPVTPSLAYCAARGHTVGFNTNQYGMSPVNEPFVVHYTIEMRRNGLFVQVD